MTTVVEEREFDCLVPVVGVGSFDVARRLEPVLARYADEATYLTERQRVVSGQVASGRRVGVVAWLVGDRLDPTSQDLSDCDAGPTLAEAAVPVESDIASAQSNATLLRVVTDALDGQHHHPEAWRAWEWMSDVIDDVGQILHGRGRIRVVSGSLTVTAAIIGDGRGHLSAGSGWVEVAVAGALVVTFLRGGAVAVDGQRTPLSVLTDAGPTRIGWRVLDRVVEEMSDAEIEAVLAD